MISRTHTLPALLALAMFGVMAIRLATGPGIGVTPDSTVYIDAARNLAGGHGLMAHAADGQSRPLTHYPPLYPAMLAFLSTWSTSIESVARWLNALLFGLNIFLVGWILSRFTTGVVLPLLGAFLALAAPDIAGIHSFALTEPLFLFFTLLVLIQLALYFDRSRLVYLITSAVAAGAALSTRYVGAVTLFTAMAALFFLSRQSMRRRMIDAALFAAIAGVPAVLWAIHNYQAASGATDRSIVFHPIKAQQIVSGVATIGTWLLLGKVRAEVRVIAFLVQLTGIAALVAYLFLSRRRRAVANYAALHLNKLPAMLAIFIVANIGFLIFTACFIDADTVLDERSLVVVHVAGLILALHLLGKVYEGHIVDKKIRIALAFAALAFAGSFALRGGNWFVQTRVDGQGYASRRWRDSKTIAQVKTQPANTPIYSNGYDAIYYLTGRRARYLPEKIIHGTGLRNQNYEVELERMKMDLQEHGGVLVYFNTLPERWFLPAESELRTRLPLTETAKNPDGSILSIAQSAEARP